MVSDIIFGTLWRVLFLANVLSAEPPAASSEFLFHFPIRLGLGFWAAVTMEYGAQGKLLLASLCAP